MSRPRILLVMPSGRRPRTGGERQMRAHALALAARRADVDVIAAVRHAPRFMPRQRHPPVP